jgi:hypothetical protein
VLVKAVNSRFHMQPEGDSTFGTAAEADGAIATRLIGKPAGA